MRILGRTALLVTMLVGLLVSQSARSFAADELVKFESAPFRLGQVQQRRAQERGETPKTASDIINGYLTKPEGSGPFPAVVYLMDALG